MQPIGRQDSRDEPGDSRGHDPSRGEGHAPAGEPTQGGEQGNTDDRGGAQRSNRPGNRSSLGSAAEVSRGDGKWEGVGERVPEPHHHAQAQQHRICWGQTGTEQANGDGQEAHDQRPAVSVTIGQGTGKQTQTSTDQGHQGDDLSQERHGRLQLARHLWVEGGRREEIQGSQKCGQAEQDLDAARSCRRPRGSRAGVQHRGTLRDRCRRGRGVSAHRAEPFTGPYYVNDFRTDHNCTAPNSAAYRRPAMASAMTCASAPT